MFKRKELLINTDFFDDQFDGLQIPEAFKITHSVETQTFIKDGLNEDEHLIDPRLRASLIIEKIASRLLVDNFINAWNQLKQIQQGQYFVHSNSSHKRRIPLIVTQEDRMYVTEQSERKLSRQKLHLEKLNNDFQGSAVQWLQKQEENIRSRSKRAVSEKYKGLSNGAESHFQRAKMLKEIVNKLKRGKHTVTSMIGEVDQIREGFQLQNKLGRLQRLVEDLHRSEMRRENVIYVTSQPQQQPKSNRGSEKSTEINQEMSKRINQEMLAIKKQMELLRQQNQTVIKRQQFKKAEMERLETERIAALKSKMNSEFDQARKQIQNLERQKYLSEQKNWQTQMQIASYNINKEQFERELGLLQKKVKELEIREQFHQQTKQQTLTHSFQRQHFMQPAPVAVSRPIIVPAQSNPFGYSTFTSSQRQSQSGWHQSTKLEKSPPPPSKMQSQQRPPLQWHPATFPPDNQSCC